MPKISTFRHGAHAVSDRYSAKGAKDKLTRKPKTSGTLLNLRLLFRHLGLR